MSKPLIPSLICHILFLVLTGPCHRNLAQPAGGNWALLQPNIGITAMHMQLLNNDRVIIFDRTDFGQSNISLSNDECRIDPNDTALTIDCTAHSVEYDVSTNSIRSLTVLTDVWCSSGTVMSDGTLIQTGGFNDGDHVVRLFKPYSGCDWKEIKNGLVQRRWYATNQLLPDDRQIVIGGRRQFNYEFYPKEKSAKSFNLPFLVQTNDRKIENNLYPFVFLNIDGNLFIFANNRAILFDYSKGLTVKTYPEMPGGDPRNYPSTGSAVLLPLSINMDGIAIEAQVLVCGGAPKGAYINALNGNFIRALNTCGIIKITDPSPQWVMETMPMGRVMGDMLLLPNSQVLIINGAAAGIAGWEYGRDPVLSPVIYLPGNSIGSRFQIQNPSTIPRMYHSTAILLRDGRILVGGSNPHIYYNFTGVIFPTELRLESFSPSYLDPGFENLRPNIILPVSQSKIGYGQWVNVQFSIEGQLNKNLVTVTMVAPPFNTHSFSMNQRLLVLSGGNVTAVGKLTYEIQVMTPGSNNLIPSGYYLLFVVHQDIPSEGIWVQIQ